MSSKDREDRLLDRFLADGRDLSSSSYDDLLEGGEGDEEARALLESLRKTGKILDEVGLTERDDCQEALRDDPVAEGEAERVFERLVRAGAAGSDARGGWRSFRRWILAAAAVLVAVFGVRFLVHDSEPGTDPGTLLGDEISIVRPRGSVETYEAFELEIAEFPPQGFVEILIYDADRPDAFEPVATVRTHGSVWIPDRELPERIRWTADLYSGNTNSVLVGGDEAFAERLPAK